MSYILLDKYSEYLTVNQNILITFTKILTYMSTKLKRGHKLYLDKDNTIESAVNPYLACRDGVVEMYSYTDCSGYGVETKLYLCQNTKHEVISVIRQTKLSDGDWEEEEMIFDSDSFELMIALIVGDKNNIHGDYIKLRNYNEN